MAVEHVANTDLSHMGIVDARWNELVIERQAVYSATLGWATTLEKLPPPETFDGLFHYEYDKNSDVIGAYDPTHDQLFRVYLDKRSRGLNVRVASGTPITQANWDSLKVLFPEAPPPPENQLSMTFWMLTPQGPQSFNRRITAPHWEAIADNYARGTKEHLAPIMDKEWRPSTGGQLILWHGEPGTGKTYAIRALAQQWKDWCDVSYVVDPEEFFGKAAYMIQVILDQSWSGGDDKWRLLILEDAGELMSTDARERTGQGLSRLLNVADGLIGQGLKVMILITTNEEVGRLHPAIVRPGRCANETRFSAMTSYDATDWLAERGIEHKVTSTMSIAELYALAEERKTKSLPRVPVGFVK